ncbi:MAG TPA: hypothetical protein VJP86_09665 [Vicinamibacterales bacterium]|nr:hypothetical protein [Vicinamibacterales bacterium]
MSGTPFVRFSKDKRGYEHVYLMHVPIGKGARPRLLYWYRTPPGVKVGREPFDLAVRDAIQAQNPNVIFDWKRISETQPPAVPEGEMWRERRRAERAAKQARVPDRPVERDPAGNDAAHDGKNNGRNDGAAPDASSSEAGPVVEAAQGEHAPVGESATRPNGGRRRRRRGRRGSRSEGPIAGPAEPQHESDTAAQPQTIQEFETSPDSESIPSEADEADPTV